MTAEVAALGHRQWHAHTLGVPKPCELCHRSLDVSNQGLVFRNDCLIVSDSRFKVMPTCLSHLN